MKKNLSASPPLLILSRKNERFKKLLLMQKNRGRRELFLIEGFREIDRAIKGKIEFESLWISPPLFLGEGEKKLIEAIAAPSFELPPPLFKEISYRDRPDGLIGVAYRREKRLEALPPTTLSSLYLVAVAIEKPGNLGTILRSSDAAGVDGVIICDRCTDIYNPNAIRSSVGTVFTQPIVESESSELHRWIKERKISIVAATPSGEICYRKAPLHGPIALLVGSEQLGLPSFWLDQADLKLRIPMRGVADSLNVAMATTLILYEAAWQRKF